MQPDQRIKSWRFAIPVRRHERRKLESSKKSENKLAVKKSKKEKKAAKDPNKPKRPPSAFFVFMEDFRKTFKEKHPNNKSVAAVGKAGGDKWKSMTDEEKAPYQAKAEKRKEEYELKMEAYNKKLAGGADDDSDKSKSEINDEDDEDSNGDSTDDGSESINELMESDRNLLHFLDSMDAYIILMNSLSSTLRQGWLELASARHSMGTTRVSSTLFDHKTHHASTTLEVDIDDMGVELPHFTLCKWVSSDDDPEKHSGEAKRKDDELSPNKPESPGVQHHGASQKSESQERREESGESPVSADNHAQKARSRSLSMFGTLVSPKLRATQLSFETALEMLVEICNLRASLLHAHEQSQKDLKAAK